MSTIAPGPGSGGPRTLAIALSGGGHRAALFGLGALMYLVDCGANRRASSIASVSGGSLTNGFVGQSLRFDRATGDEFRRRAAQPLAATIARRGTLFGSAWTWCYLAGLVVLAILIVAVGWRAPVSGWWRTLIVVIGLGVWGWAFGRRGDVCAAAFGATLFSRGKRATLLSELEAGIDHVLCATELQAAEQIYFARDFVYSYQLGTGVPGDLPLARAVQASAAFPGGFPPARLPAGRHHFTGSPSGRTVRSLVLSDGGVYDNMADQWARGFASRAARPAAPCQGRQAPDQLVVVNSTARMPWRGVGGFLIPLIGELLALLRVSDVMYVNTTNVRRQDIVASYDPLHPGSAHGLPAALVQIAQSPFHVADAFRPGGGDPARRAAEVIAALGEDTRDAWQEIARLDGRVGTTLKALGIQTAARLLRHGYVLAMCNLYVIFGEGDFPLLQVPALEPFLDLVAGRAAAAREAPARVAAGGS